MTESLRWPGLRPIQQRALAPIAAGAHTLLIAGTAGGKTEAAFFAWASRALGEPPERRGAAVWLAPTRALATQLADRLRALGDLLGVSVALRHSDTSRSERDEALRDPPDLLVTTPESIEALLLRGRAAALARVQIAIVDEFHLFAEGSRGVHLAFLIARLEAERAVAVQRIGLSATVTPAEEVWSAWVGGAAGPRRVVEVPAAPRARDLLVDLIEDHDALHGALAATLARRRALVFCNTRADVERTTRGLRAHGLHALAHHGRLDRAVREAAEDAMRGGAPSALVCTSTLEVGIDLGGLDAVAQVGAPRSVASFTQRVGRAARRAGAVAGVWMLARTPADARLAWAIVTLAMEGWLEPTTAPDPTPVVWHQLVALCAAHGHLPETRTAALLRAVLGDSAPCLDALCGDLERAGWLERVDGVWVIGAEAERRFGGRSGAGLCATFGDGRRVLTAELAGDPVAELDASVDTGDVVLVAGEAYVVTRRDDAVAELAPAPAGAAKSPRGGGWGARRFGHDPMVAARAARGAGDEPRPAWIGERAWTAVRATR